MTSRGPTDMPVMLQGPRPLSETVAAVSDYGAPSLGLCLHSMLQNPGMDVGVAPAEGCRSCGTCVPLAPIPNRPT